MKHPACSFGQVVLGRAIAAASLVILLAAPAAAQLVTPKTAPVHQGNQFGIFPTSRPGMGGLSIAVDDTLLDPFSNPAKAVRIREGMLFTSPFAHSVSESRGGGRTLPAGGMGTSGSWAGGGVFALQQLDRAGPGWNRELSERTATNQYISILAGHRLSPDLAVGFGAYRANLGAIDGVDLLYGGSDRIEQQGTVSDLRLGIVHERVEGGTLEMLLLHNRTNMRHDVRFPDQFRWEPPTWQPVLVERAREELNLDRTHIWGAHTQYSRPIGAEGWRVGWLATANRLSHPKIPNYVFMNIPRDPGTTYALNLGVGAARTLGPVTFGVDLIYEPMWSETWADAELEVVRPDGRVIAAGDRTVENYFVFSNSKIRAGLSREMPRGDDSTSTLGFQLGLEVYSIDYGLEQTNHLAGSFRTQRENWMEWSPAAAVRLRTRQMEVSVATRVTCVEGCDFGFGMDVVQAAAPPGGGGIIAAPSGPLFIRGGTAYSSRITIAVPIR